MCRQRRIKRGTVIVVVKLYPEKMSSLEEAEKLAKEYDGMTSEEVFQLRQKYNGPLLTFYPEKPLLVTRGWKQYLFDDKGKRYLDLFAGEWRLTYLYIKLGFRFCTSKCDVLS